MAAATRAETERTSVDFGSPKSTGETKSQDTEEAVQDVLDRANILYKEEHYPEAAAAFSTALRLDPSCEVALSGRAGCLLNMTKDQLDVLEEHLDVGKSRMELAQQDVDRCLQINGQSADGHCRKGQLLLQLSRPWDAKDAFRAAMELDKNSKEAAVGYQRCLTVLDLDVHQARVRISQQPGVRRCLQDQRMKEALKLMQEDPMQARRLMRDSVVVREGLHLLVQSGAIMLR